MQQNDRRNYMCRDCLTKLTVKKRRGRKSQKELEEILRLKEQESFKSEHLPENP